MKTLRVSFVIGCYVKQGSLACRDDCQSRKPLGSRMTEDGFACRDEGQSDNPLGSRMAKVNALRELQSTSGEELSALMPSILDKAFKGEL